ncbi:TetR/AcrR family transcriptional regulator [Amycolatopsis magusensis]|uniref:AcrR family transcriptional regulator n=1 Tax=Amycolatopsis magusensis TaxID=882444 RepID=A0ABS4PI13_9PSEU|nr:TetR/AcrR family transcriptional regulator [Amycolatopsis magusensis]MBP2179008.1 AcrR family transcriptional regulator [Amycolatopsis magusensis]
MPKVVDRAERQREIAGALLTLVAREGIEAVSIRAVAAEAGISAGAVQKYFSSKEELLREAFDLTGLVLVERWRGLDTTGPLLDVLRRHILAALPLDAQTRSELLVALAFTVQAATRPEWAEKLREDYAWTLQVTTEFLQHGQDNGDFRTDLPAAALAELVIALTEGMANRMLHTTPGGEVHTSLLQSLDLALRELVTPR